MNDPEPALQTPAISPVDDVFTISKPSPRIVMAPARDAAAAAPQSKDRDSFAVTALADITDRSLHAAVARFTAGLSPAALAQAYLDWATHLANAPGKQMQLVDKAMRKARSPCQLRSVAAPWRAAPPSAASSRCRRTGASPARTGSGGPTTSSTRRSCSISNGGTTRRPAFAAYPGSTKTWSSSCRARSSTWSRRRTSC